MGEVMAAGIIADGHFAYRSGMCSLRLLDRDRLLADTHLASRLGYALARHFFLARLDVIVTPSIWGGGLAQWVGYFLEPRKMVIYATPEGDAFHFSPGPEYVENRRVLVVDNLIMTGKTITSLVRSVSAAGGIPIGIGTLANLSGISFPIDVVGLLNDELHVFDPKREPEVGAGIPVTEVGY
jgi:orotate phosphoribosyltransferase